MLVTLMKGKIHRAVVTGADLHYEGSISIDRALIDAAGFFLHERVDVYNINTGARFSTYVIEAPAGSGVVGLNGAAARLAMAGDQVIIAAYAQMSEAEAKSFVPRVVLVDDGNQPIIGLPNDRHEEPIMGLPEDRRKEPIMGLPNDRHEELQESPAILPVG